MACLLVLNYIKEWAWLDELTIVVSGYFFIYINYLRQNVVFCIMYFNLLLTFKSLLILSINAIDYFVNFLGIFFHVFGNDHFQVQINQESVH